MAKYLSLEIGEASWPKCCAQCLRKNFLTQYEKDTERTTKTNYIFFSKFVTRSYKNNYPVCKTHHADIDHSEQLLFFLKFILIGILLVSIVPIGMYLKLGQQGGYATLAVVLICALTYYMWLTISKIPIWVYEIGDDFVTLRFSNDKYADEFLRENKESCKISYPPWVLKK